MKRLMPYLNPKFVVKLALLIAIVAAPIITFMPDESAQDTDSVILIAQAPTGQKPPVPHIINSDKGGGDTNRGNSWGG